LGRDFPHSTGLIGPLGNRDNLGFYLAGWGRHAARAVAGKVDTIEHLNGHPPAAEEWPVASFIRMECCSKVITFLLF
jgi:hypothetical protein